MQSAQTLPSGIACLPAAGGIDAAAAASELEALAATSGRVLIERRAYKVLLARGDEIPAAMLAIGALRAETFRLLGEGTDAAIDLDDYDLHYEHLIVWNDAEREIVGAYRLSRTSARGTTPCGAALYTETLYRYDPSFFAALSPAVELGRAFVQPKYQRAVEPLFLLWQGIGRYLADRPEHRYLFGAVSISKHYHPRSRRLILSYLRDRHETPARGLVRARRPASFRMATDLGGTKVADADLRDLETRVRAIEGGKRGVPVLIHRYLELGGAFVAFHDDSLFNSIACLIVVDVRKLEARALARFMGKEQAERYAAYAPRTSGSLPPSPR